MPISNGYDEKAVTEAVATALETFYNNLIAKIDELNIQKIMKRKNPYESFLIYFVKMMEVLIGKNLWSLILGIDMS